LPRVGTAEIFALYAVQPARASPAEKHCAAQAEYGRLAAQAYSPSDAMSQARFCLGGMEKGSTPPETICRAICGHSKMRVAGRTCREKAASGCGFVLPAAYS